MNLRQIDLNLLVILHQLLQDRSVSTSADKLGLTQPAVSNALKRLRAMLKDDLFVRTARGMEPTPYALHLAAPVGEALATLKAAFDERDAFDPATSTRTFTLSMTDIGEIYFMPPLLKALATLAPHIQISTARNTAGNLKEEMEAGNVDLALGLLPHLTTGFFQRRLFKQRYVCMFRKDHPTATNPISMKSYAALEHLGIIAANTGHGEVDALIAKRGIQRRVRLHVPHFIAVGHILQSSDLIATVPERFAVHCEAPFNLAISPLPMKLPDIAIHLFWHAKYNRDPASMWLRQLMVSLFADAAL
jgi:DNA-binding transcriptional LysR family regulator